ncbi:MAG: hypothetical protein KVP17_005000 [Porospora cf. gigantea B]|uniref:uncharacterized protein n=1 Tax=Porospora cf. gigantea B TaxID=2853592 RepID=UPI00357189DC|nr:MAG: hypothetical protein KVP17_005000 [Porospora cf. gigantea B]
MNGVAQLFRDLTASIARWHSAPADARTLNLLRFMLQRPLTDDELLHVVGLLAVMTLVPYRASFAGRTLEQYRYQCKNCLLVAYGMVVDRLPNWREPVNSQLAEDIQAVLCLIRGCNGSLRFCEHRMCLQLPRCDIAVIAMCVNVAIEGRERISKVHFVTTYLQSVKTGHGSVQKELSALARGVTTPSDFVRNFMSMKVSMDSVRLLYLVDSLDNLDFSPYEATQLADGLRALLAQTSGALLSLLLPSLLELCLAVFPSETLRRVGPHVCPEDCLQMEHLLLAGFQSGESLAWSVLGSHLGVSAAIQPIHSVIRRSATMCHPLTSKLLATACESWNSFGYNDLLLLAQALALHSCWELYDQAVLRLLLTYSHHPDEKAIVDLLQSAPARSAVILCLTCACLNSGGPDITWVPPKGWVAFPSSRSQVAGSVYKFLRTASLYRNREADCLRDVQDLLNPAAAGTLLGLPLQRRPFLFAACLYILAEDLGFMADVTCRSTNNPKKTARSYSDLCLILFKQQPELLDDLAPICSECQGLLNVSTSAVIDALRSALPPYHPFLRLDFKRTEDPDLCRLLLLTLLFRLGSSRVLCSVVEMEPVQGSVSNAGTWSTQTILDSFSPTVLADVTLNCIRGLRVDVDLTLMRSSVLAAFIHDWNGIYADNPHVVAANPEVCLGLLKTGMGRQWLVRQSALTCFEAALAAVVHRGIARASLNQPGAGEALASEITASTASFFEGMSPTHTRWKTYIDTVSIIRDICLTPFEAVPALRLLVNVEAPWLPDGPGVSNVMGIALSCDARRCVGLLPVILLHKRLDALFTSASYSQVQVSLESLNNLSAHTECSQDAVVNSVLTSWSAIDGSLLDLPALSHPSRFANSIRQEAFAESYNRIRRRTLDKSYPVYGIDAHIERPADLGATSLISVLDLMSKQYSCGTRLGGVFLSLLSGQQQARHTCSLWTVISRALRSRQLSQIAWQALLFTLIRYTLGDRAEPQPSAVVTCNRCIKPQTGTFDAAPTVSKPEKTVSQVRVVLLLVHFWGTASTLGVEDVSSIPAGTALRELYSRFLRERLALPGILKAFAKSADPMSTSRLRARFKLNYPEPERCSKRRVSLSLGLSSKSNPSVCANTFLNQADFRSLLKLLQLLALADSACPVLLPSTAPEQDLKVRSRKWVSVSAVAQVTDPNPRADLLTRGDSVVYQLSPHEEAVSPVVKARVSAWSAFIMSVWRFRPGLVGVLLESFPSHDSFAASIAAAKVARSLQTEILMDPHTRLISLAISSLQLQKETFCGWMQSAEVLFWTHTSPFSLSMENFLLMISSDCLLLPLFRTPDSFLEFVPQAITMLDSPVSVWVEAELAHIAKSKAGSLLVAWQLELRLETAKVQGHLARLLENIGVEEAEMHPFKRVCAVSDYLVSLQPQEQTYAEDLLPSRLHDVFLGSFESYIRERAPEAIDIPERPSLRTRIFRSKSPLSKVATSSVVSDVPTNVSFEPVSSVIEFASREGCGQLIGARGGSVRIMQSAAKVPLLVEFIKQPDAGGCESLKLIFKARDDLRTDQLAVQFIEICQAAFHMNNLDIRLKPYKIVPLCTNGHPGGVIEVVPEALSRHQIAQKGYSSLTEYYLAEHGPPESRGFQRAQDNFLRSLVGYGIVSYLLQIKDRHNGNLLYTADGHVLHIDFGFLFDSSPGGDLGFEKAPFKLTSEMGELLLAGPKPRSRVLRFKELFVQGFLAARDAAHLLVPLVRMMIHSGLPCFRKRSLESFRYRFRSDLPKTKVIRYIEKLIVKSGHSFSTKMYDVVQNLQQGIQY